jgi:hypothetical protein
MVQVYFLKFNREWCIFIIGFKGLSLQLQNAFSKLADFCSDRCPEAFVQDLAGVRRLRQEVRLRHHDEEAPGHAYRREALLV